MTDKRYTVEEIKNFLRKHMSEERAVEALNSPLPAFGMVSAVELLDRTDDDYSADVMGTFRRIFE